MVKKRAENIGQHCGDIRNDFELCFRIVAHIKNDFEFHIVAHHGNIVGNLF